MCITEINYTDAHGIYMTYEFKTKTIEKAKNIVRNFQQRHSCFKNAKITHRLCKKENILD